MNVMLILVGLVFCSIGGYFLFKYQQIFTISPKKARKIEAAYFKTNGLFLPLLSKKELRSIEKKAGSSSQLKYLSYLFLGLGLLCIGFICILYPLLNVNK